MLLMGVLLHNTAEKYLNRLNATDRKRIYEGNLGILRLREGNK